MVFVTVGTQDFDFVRIFDYCSRNIQEDLIFQLGETTYNSNTQSFKYSEKYPEYMSEANYIVAHGGVGTIIDVLKQNKKVIVVPRLAENKEHVNNHQLEITLKLAADGFILYALTEEDFISKVSEIEFFKPKKFISNTSNFNSKVNDIIEELS